MLNFTSKHDIEQIKIPPGQPFANNLEATVMRPLLNAIKIGYVRNQNEVETFSSFLTRLTLKSCSFPIHGPGEIKNSHEPPMGRNFFFGNLFF